MQECTISGILLAVTQIACATGLHYNEPFLYKQLIANIIIFVATNIAGILTHYPCEVAQRQAFMETRQCIEARLTTQRENQQQVYHLLFIAISVLVLGKINFLIDHQIEISHKISYLGEAIVIRPPKACSNGDEGRYRWKAHG